ncbi:MAG: Holliday junction branch migration protein RuvA [Clostridiales bacterium]|nr:Holliday junction branch migration protein RuvA [Clostridiales bacterium]
MIAFVRGNIFAVNEDSLIIEMGGLGFLVLAPLKHINPRPVIGQEIMLHTHLQIREDAWQLYGFCQEEQLVLFRHLLAVSGIGAKTALAIVDNISAGNIMRALAEGNFDLFCQVPGVGKKTAQRLVVDLKDKFALPFGQAGAGDGMGLSATLNTAMPSAYGDLLAALEQLGYRGAEGRALALQAYKNLGESALPAQLVQEALKLAVQG